jgi:lipopolysaccharide/colanic/teichoic acid biosynthesis glycosyltransferase
MRAAWIRVFPVGAVLLCVASGFAHARYSTPRYVFGSQNSVAAYVALALLHVLVAAVAGVPDEADDLQPALFRATSAAAITTGIWLVIQALSHGLLPRQVILGNAALQATWSFFCALMVLRHDRRRHLQERVVAVVAVNDVAVLQEDCSLTFPVPEQAFQLVAAFPLDDLGPDPATVHQQIARFDPSLVVLTDAATTIPRVVDAVTMLHRNRVKVRTVAQFYEEYLGKESLAELTKMTMLFDVRTLHNTTYRRMKRAIDFVGGVVGCLIVVLIVPFVWIGNLVANRGPMLFGQDRVGRDGNVFRMYKLRTMRVDTPDVDQQSWTSPDDPRVTPFGRLLRRSHIDELPQCWNIVRRELSLVGPRPEQPHYVEELTAKEPAYELRHLITPGLTGWAQIKHRYASTEAAAIEKLRFDLYYLRNQSLALDLRILSRTVRSVLRRHGR